MNTMDPTMRDGLRTAAGVLHLVAAHIEAVARGTKPVGDLTNAADVLEGQATVLREWLPPSDPVCVHGVTRGPDDHCPQCASSSSSAFAQALADLDAYYRRAHAFLKSQV
jgi:hypothetical protein